MYKIDEKVDLSKKVLDIDIESEVFNCLKQDLNKEIQRCIFKVFNEAFESEEITVKLGIEIPEAYKSFPKTDEFGEKINETFKYRKPNFEHKVTSTLKKQYKQEGFYSEERDVQYDGKKFVAISIKEAQTNMFDKE